MRRALTLVALLATSCGGSGESETVGDAAGAGGNQGGASGSGGAAGGASGKGGAGAKAGGAGAGASSGQSGSAGVSGAAGAGAAGAGGGGGGSGGGAGQAGKGGASAGAGGSAGKPAHVAIEGGRLLVDGQPTFLYGGDLHYFRVRDAGFDAAKTKAMWGQTLDLMKAAGMNLVTTYLPWDYHSVADGTWDFTGARDVGAFLKMACDKGMYVVAKPGPLITGEWPRGFGTYGAVPAWWKTAHPEALVRNAKGDLWTYSPTGDASQRQPTYLHPAYLAAVKDWYAQVFPRLEPFKGKCLVAVQIDNETNLYWGGRFGDVDYSDTAVAHYREFLQKEYGTIAALNQRYQTSHASFSAVTPPTSAPGTGAGELPKNPWYADWYFAGLAYVHDYLVTLKGMFEASGFAPPDALHFTNDSPFPLELLDFTLRDVLLHDGPTKNPVGLAGLDLYPKQFPTNGHLQDQPFQADYFTRLFDAWGDAATGKQGFAYAAELQGGFYAYPVVGQPDVRPQATDQLLARTIGRGLKGGSFYVVRDGLNLDNSKYDYQAAIKEDGSLRPRYDVMKRWGAMLAKHGTALLDAKPVTDSVVVLMNRLHAAPQGGLLDNMQRFTGNEQPALFGWLANAGFDPDVLDVTQASLADLAQYKVAFYQNPSFVDEPTAEKLAQYVEAGGMLVGALWNGKVDDTFKASPATTKLSTEIFPAQEEGYWVWAGPSRSGDLNAKLPGLDEKVEGYWYQSYWSAPSGAGITPFAWERTAPFGTNGKVIGYVAEGGGKKRAFLGTNVWTRFNQEGYYALDPAEIARKTTLARYLVGQGGVSPRIVTQAPRHLAWARRSGKQLFLFVINDNDTDDVVHVTFADLAGLGLDAATPYTLTDVLGDKPLGVATGAQIGASGLSVPTPKWSSAVVLLAP